MTDDPLTTLYNDDGELDKRRVKRILDLERENSRMREVVQDVANYPEYQNEDGWLMVLRTKARAILADEQQ